MRLYHLLAAMAGVVLSTSAIAQTTVVNDRFDDGAVTDGSDTADIAWYGVDNQAVATVNTADQPMGAAKGNVMDLTLTGNNRSLHGYFAGQTLANAGDYIQLSMDYKYDSAAFSQGLRFGLVNSMGSIATSGTTAGTIDGDTGYGFSLNPGADATNNEVVRYTMSGVTASYVRVGTAGFSTTDPGDTVHNLTLKIARTAGGDLDITASMDGVFSSLTRTDLAANEPNYFFDQIYVRLGGSGNRGPVYLDNVVVTAVVPEPSVMAVAGLAILALLRRRRYH